MISRFLLLVLFSLGVFGAASAQSVDLSAGPWRLQLDESAAWKDDALFLPDEVDLAKLPVNAPTGGWATLSGPGGLNVTLPSTVEEHFWGKTGGGERPYANGEYFYWNTDPDVKNGNYLGVSWWSREFTAPALAAGQRLMLNFRGARLRAEVYVNQKLVAYHVVGETPFSADITDAVKPGAGNQLAVRITNPGGFLDWTDWGPPIKWGKYDIPRSHGFGGLDAGIVMEVRDAVQVAELAVLNRPNPREITFVVDVASSGPAYRGPVALAVTTPDGRPVWSGTVGVNVPAKLAGTAELTVTIPEAQLWDLDQPTLYRATATVPGGAASARAVTFGFRWFQPEGIHDNAIFRLNGKRIVLRTAISWGYWKPNGLWPTDELAEKEVRAAKELGLNCLQFHRNIGRPNVLAAHDRLGLLRYEEPGAGKNAYTPLDQMGGIAGVRANPTIPPYPLTGDNGEPSEWRMRYEVAKILAMVKRDRSHPSLVLYCLQNEQAPPLTWKPLPWLFRRIQAIDPSRTVYLHSGIPTHNQLVALPYQHALLHEDGTGYSGWFDKHTVGGPGVYRDELYTDPREFSHRGETKAEVITWGEMLGSGMPDDHQAIVEEARRTGKPGYDFGVHERALAAYDAFLDREGFRGAFPTASSLFRGAAAKSYHFWGKILEQTRASDENDSLVISGWESTTIENHAGLVDARREFRADPKLLNYAMAPEIVVVRPRRMVLATGEEAVVDVHLVSETERAGAQTLAFAATAENGQVLFERSYPVKATGGDVFGELLQEAIRFQVPTAGLVTLRAKLTGAAGAPVLEREEQLRVIAPSGPKLLANVGVIESGQQVRTALAEAFGVTALDGAKPAQPLDALILANGASWNAQTQYVGEEFGNAPDKQLYRNFAHGKTGVIGVWDGLSTGFCKVELFLGEYAFNEAGKRVFDVAINGETVLKDFDAFKEAGGRLKAIVKTFDVDLPAGTIKVEIPRCAVNRATLAGMRITDGNGKVVTVAFREKAYVDPSGREWAPFGLAGMAINEELLTAALKRVHDDGLRLIFWTNGMGDAAAAAQKLAAHGIVKFDGPVAEARASWMGSWYFVRSHWLFDGLPVDRVFSWEYQVPAAGPGVGGLKLAPINGNAIETMVGYGRDHEPQVGAGAVVIRHGKGLIVLPSIPGLREALTDTNAAIVQPVARRLLANALRADDLATEGAKSAK